MKAFRMKRPEHLTCNRVPGPQSGMIVRILSNLDELEPSWGFPHSSVGKESTCNAGNPSSSPGSGRSAGEGIEYPLQYSWTFLVTQLVEICLQCGRPGFDLWVGKRPWRRERRPTPVFRPGELHGLYSMGSQRVGHD